MPFNTSPTLIQTERKTSNHQLYGIKNRKIQENFISISEILPLWIQTILLLCLTATASSSQRSVWRQTFPEHFRVISQVVRQKVTATAHRKDRPRTENHSKPETESGQSEVTVRVGREEGNVSDTARSSGWMRSKERRAKQTKSWVLYLM